MAGWLTVFFVLLTPVAAVTGLVNSLAFVNYLSLVALILAAGSWWSAADAKAAVDEEEAGPGGP